MQFKITIWNSLIDQYSDALEWFEDIINSGVILVRVCDVIFLNIDFEINLLLISLIK